MMVTAKLRAEISLRPWVERLPPIALELLMLVVLTLGCPITWLFVIEVKAR